MSAVSDAEILLAFLFLKEKRMHHFPSAFASPLLPTALGSKSSPSLFWFPQKVVLAWHVALQNVLLADLMLK